MRRQTLQERLQNVLLKGDWPTWEDLKDDRVAIPGSLVEDAEQRLDRYRCCILDGAEGRGKTSLARYVGYRAAKENKPVYHIDAADQSGHSAEQISTFISSADYSAPLYIVENLSEIASANDLRLLASAASSAQRSQFLFAFRRAGQSPGVDEVAQLLDRLGLDPADVMLAIQPGPDRISLIVDKHIKLHRDRALSQPSDVDIDEIAKRCGRNLRVLRAYLDAWDSGPLLGVDEEKMLRISFQQRFGMIDPRCHLALVGISGVAQFGVAAPGPVFGLSEARDLARQGWLGQRYFGLDEYFMPAHSTDAAINVRAWALVHNRPAEDVTKEALQRYLAVIPAYEGVGLLLVRLSKSVRILRSVLSDDNVSHALRHDFRSALDKAPLSFVWNRIEASKGTALERDLAHEVVRRGSSWLLTRMREADQEEASWALNYFRNLDPNLTREVSGALTADDWIAIWLRLPLARLVKFMWRYADEPGVHEHTEQARLALRQLSETEGLGAKIRTLSLELVGKLLLEARKLDESAHLRIGRCVVDSLALSASSDTLKLTLILKELRSLPDKTIHAKLLARVLREVPFEAFVRDVSGQGVALTLVDAASAARQGLLQQVTLSDLLVKTVSSDVTWFERWSAVAVQAFLWAGVQIGSDLVRQWARRLGFKSFTNILVGAQKPKEVFYGLWNLWLVDQALCGRVATGVQEAMATNQAQWQLTVDMLPLLGLLAWLIPGALATMSLPRPEAVAGGLLQQGQAAPALFAWCCYSAVDAQQGREFAKHAWPHIASLREKIQALPVESGREVLLSLLERVAQEGAPENPP